MNLLLALLVSCAAPARAIPIETIRVAKPASAGGGTSAVEVVSGQALVRFSEGTSTAAAAGALSSRGMTLGAEVGATGWWAVGLPTGLSVESGLLQLSAVSGVAEASPNHAYRVSRVPNDPYYPQQYHLGKINAEAAWEYDTGGSTLVTVAVADVGIDPSHADLSGKFVGTPQFCDPGACKTTLDCLNPAADNSNCTADTPQRAACNHATRVAGVAAASSNNGVGVSGVSWGAKLLSLRIFRTADCTTNCEDTTCGTDDTAIADAISYARSINNTPTYGRVVLNLSLGEQSSCPSVIQNAITPAVAGSTGVVIVVAAGNESASSVDAPANCAGVIPVAATDENDNVASFSNQGPELAANGVAAPGVNLTTTDLGGGYTGSATGTSFSSPLVAGVAALILDSKPSFSPTQVKDTLRGSADTVGLAAVASARPSGNAVGAGRVNAFKAMKLSVDGTLAGYEGDSKVIAFPNPFHTATDGVATISVPASLQGQGLHVRVYTIAGQLVRDLGAKTTWDARNDHGNQVASGVYLVLVKLGSSTQTFKLAVVR
ncbi:MAG: S8 family peptidase [Elusimicrobia bacterium]|nr:S8 family peptidase [Elusimicrobiota bacterium]